MSITETPIRCSICGFIAKPNIKTTRSILVRDSYACRNCGGLMRHRDIAQIILDRYGLGESNSIKELVTHPNFSNRSVYEVGIKGPLCERLQSLPDYTMSYYWQNLPLGFVKDGVSCQDLRNLTFDDDQFDLVISIDVLEHVFEPEKAIAAISRVLKPGGMHVFSIPTPNKLAAKSRVRAKVSDGEISYLHKPVFHVAGDDAPSLVVTDWGRDIVNLHKSNNLDLRIIRRSAPVPELSGCITFVAVK